MNNIERLHKRTFWSCFWGIATISSFIILPLGILPIALSGHAFSGLRLTVFVAGCWFIGIGIALLFAELVPLYANVIDRKERVRRLVQLCRFGEGMASCANWPLLLWQKVFKPAGLYVGGFIAVALFALGLWLSSLTKASKEEEKEDSWIDAWLG